MQEQTRPKESKAEQSKAKAELTSSKERSKTTTLRKMIKQSIQWQRRQDKQPKRRTKQIRTKLQGQL